MAERPRWQRGHQPPMITGDPRFRIVGRLSAVGAEEPRVEVWARGKAGDILLASSGVEADGSYRLGLGESLEERPDVFLRAIAGGRTIATSEASVYWGLNPRETRIDLEAPEVPVITGRVLDELHRPVADAVVRVDRLLQGGERSDFVTTA